MVHRTNAQSQGYSFQEEAPWKRGIAFNLEQASRVTISGRSWSQGRKTPLRDTETLAFVHCLQWISKIFARISFLITGLSSQNSSCATWCSERMAQTKQFLFKRTLYMAQQNHHFPAYNILLAAACMPSNSAPYPLVGTRSPVAPWPCLSHNNGQCMGQCANAGASASSVLGPMYLCFASAIFVPGLYSCQC